MKRPWKSLIRKPILYKLLNFVWPPSKYIEPDSKARTAHNWAVRALF